MTICYFSATGNCLYVARRIGGTLLSIPQLMRQETIEIKDDAVGVVCPVYNAEMPMMVKAFMERVNIQTGYFFFIYTYGAGFGEGYAHAKLAAQGAGLTLCYVNAIQMVDNFIPYFDMQEQIDTLPKKNVEGQIETVCADIAARKTLDLRSRQSQRRRWQCTISGWRSGGFGRIRHSHIPSMATASAAESAQRCALRTTSRSQKRE